MKIMIASDIHGSAYYLEQLLNRYDEENPDKLLLLGDILYHGPRNDLPKGYAPKDVILLLAISFDAIKNYPKPVVRVHKEKAETTKVA